MTRSSAWPPVTATPESDSDGDEVGRGPTEQSAIYEAIKAAHRRMITRLRKADAFRKSLREFIGGE